jgi:mRNA-degrading endonuclease RelE of RelBE toxin-antitoxin system
VSDRTYAIAWTATAQRSLSKAPEKVAAAVVEFLYGSLAVNPSRVGKPLRLDFEGMHRARRGDYRIIYRIDYENRRVEILAIEHRADAYRSTLEIPQARANVPR